MKHATVNTIGAAVLWLLSGCIYAMTSDEPPPAPQVEAVVVAPAPGLIWIAGEWTWQGRWVWVSGYWGRPPHPHAVWVPSSWEKHGKQYHRKGGHWK